MWTSQTDRHQLKTASLLKFLNSLHSLADSSDLTNLKLSKNVNLHRWAQKVGASNAFKRSCWVVHKEHEQIITTDWQGIKWSKVIINFDLPCSPFLKLINLISFESDWNN